MNNITVIFEGYMGGNYVFNLDELLETTYDPDSKEHYKQLYDVHNLIYIHEGDRGWNWRTKIEKSLAVNWCQVVLISQFKNMSTSEVYLTNGYVLTVCEKALKEALKRIEDLTRLNPSVSSTIRVNAGLRIYINEPNMNVKTDL